MAIKHDFFNYLDHFGETVSLNTLNSSQQPDLVALRHDVDHSIDVALEMAFWEHDHGVRSTYFILPGTTYWNEDLRLVEKCLQIQDFGHEVGLHVNTIAEWIDKGQDPETGIEGQLKRLRDGGVKIDGIAAHGDRLCYSTGFINYWAFQELRPENPALRETGLTAEGIPAGENGRPLIYPESHKLQHPAKRLELSLWQVSMKKHSLDYHATHLPYDRYFTDSGGSWKVAGDPLLEDLSHGRIQINIHPIHWRDEPKIYFFLSTARSSSKWLATTLNKASSAKANHEDFLNFTYEDGEKTHDHRTGPDYAKWAKNDKNIDERLLAARNWVLDQPATDRAEVNVYLERHIDKLKKVFPQANFVFLHRAPHKVLNSIMNRDWYDTASDNRHPVPEGVRNWAKLSQFERCCHYVRDTMTRLSSTCSQRVSSEELTVSPEHCSAVLKSLGICFYPRLTENSFHEAVNANKTETFPELKKWSVEQKQHYMRLCGPTEQILGYESPIAISLINQVPHIAKSLLGKIELGNNVSTFNVPNRVWFQSHRAASPGVETGTDHFQIDQDEKGSRYIYLGFKKAKKEEKIVFATLGDGEYTLSFSQDVQGKRGAFGQVFLIEDVGSGLKHKRRLLRRMELGSDEVKLSFRPSYATTHFGFLFQLPGGSTKAKIEIRNFKVQFVGKMNQSSFKQIKLRLTRMFS